MMTPMQLEGESVKAYNAFKIYCEVGGSTTKVARRLACSRQNVDKWFSKYRWKERFTALRQRDCEQKIAAETKATEAVATITEMERASVARRAFDVASRCINRADEILEQHPVSAVRLLAVGVDVAAAVGGVARNFATAAPNIEIVTQFIGQNGQPVEAPPEITSVEQAEAIIAEYEAERSERGLPLDWPRERPPPKRGLPVRGETVNGDSAKPE
jgi:hypothetical protein